MSDETETIGRSGAGRAQPGKYLTFLLDRQEYGIEIMKVREIIGLMEITAVPRTPAFVKGVINLRGNVIPVMDLRAKFALPAVAATLETCIVVVEVRIEGEQANLGVIVDAVSEVLDIAAGEIEPPPAFGGGVHTDFLLGMAKVKDRVKLLLDIDRILQVDELVAIGEMSHE